MKSKTHALFGATMLMTVTVDLEGKRKRTATEHVKAWVDPEGCRRFIASKRRAFEDKVDAENGRSKGTSKEVTNAYAKTRPNQAMKPTAPLRNNFTEFATDPARWLSSISLRGECYL